jgi:hypothetical protein
MPTKVGWRKLKSYSMKKLLIAAAILLGSLSIAEAATGEIIKTLPHFLDLQGRHMLRPSLYERDAYQAQLRLHPERCSGMRFDIQWKAHRLTSTHPKLRLEVKAANLPPRQIEVFEQELKKPGFFSKWSGVVIAGDTFKRIGLIQAWHVSLWDGDQMLAEQKSFLW